MHFAIYEISGGRITSVANCNLQEQIAHMVDKGRTSAVECASDTDGAIHLIEGGKRIEFAPKPSPFHQFDYTLKQWIDPRTLQDLKDAKWTAIKQARAAAIDSPLVTPYGTFDSNVAARTSITDAVLMLQTLEGLGQPTTIDFTLANNSTVTLTTAQMVQVALLLGAQVQVSHARSRALRLQIEAATTPEGVAAIVWTVAP